MINHFRIVTNKFVCGISVENQTVIKTAPILGKFYRKNIIDLMDYLDEYYPDFTIEKSNG